MADIKDYQVIFDTAGHVETVKEITNPAVPQHKRTLVVRASNISEAIKSAKTLFSLAK